MYQISAHQLWRVLTKCLIKFLILNKNKWFEHAVCSDLCPDISSVAHESQQLEHLNVRDFFWPGLKMFVRWRSGYPVIWEQYEHTYSIVFFSHTCSSTAHTGCFHMLLASYFVFFSTVLCSLTNPFCSLTCF